jgi:hypothetical protein
MVNALSIELRVGVSQLRVTHPQFGLGRGRVVAKRLHTFL